MIITYLRSSSWNNYDFCQQQYYINYVLGIDRSVGVKGVQGTVVHKVLECLAIMKKQFQNSENDKIIFNDDMLESAMYIDKDNFLKESILTKADVDAINKTRINKYKYPEGCFLNAGHKRYGVDIVEYLIERAIKWYGGDAWQNAERKDCHNWTWMAVDFKNGLFDPRKSDIFATEQRFDIEIKKPWSRYSYDFNGEKISGYLALKGTIDLICREGEDTLEIRDYKTGQMKNWATGEKKTFSSLCKDFQLMLYYYAARKTFPDFKNILVTIFFIRDGGPVTVHFDDNCLQDVELKICERFNAIKKNIAPQMCDPTQKDFKCSKICDYYKMPSPDGNTNFCKFIHNAIKEHGIDYVTNMYKNINHNIDTYHEPGAQ